MWTINGGGEEDDESSAPAADGSITSPAPVAWLTILLFFGHARELYLIGKALADKYPTAAEFEAARNEPALQQAAQEFAQLLNVLRGRAQSGGLWDVQALETAGAEHYGEALATVRSLATTLGLEPDTLLAALASL